MPFFNVKIIFSVVALALTLVGMSLLSSEPTLIAERAKDEIIQLVKKSDTTPDISGEAIIIERLKTEEVLFKRDSSRKLPIASLTKLMSALIIEESIDPLEEIEFSGDAKSVGQSDDKRSEVDVGERIKSEDLVKMMLISSYSDAAYAAAEHTAIAKKPELGFMSFQERVSFFVELMNQRAQKIGLSSTHFANPSGSDDQNNFSTAEDIAVLTKYINENAPELWTASRIQETFVFGRENRSYGLTNTNPLLKEYPSIYGSKTGFEDQAKGALLMLYQLARRDPVAIVILKSGDRFRDGEEAIKWLESNFVLESK